MGKKKKSIKLLLATKNQDKIKEIKKIFKQEDFDLVTMEEFNFPDVKEDLKSIEANAKKKALETSRATGLTTIADDTGLFVSTLKGKPGAQAARFAGAHCTYRDNRIKLLTYMKGKINRKAEFRTVVALAGTDGIIAITVGVVKGIITKEEVGSEGFGYDSIFRADETGRTFGEMNIAEKEMISHRGRAFRKMIPILKEYLNRSQYG